MIISVAALVAALVPVALGGRPSRLAALPCVTSAGSSPRWRRRSSSSNCSPVPAALLETAHIATYVIAGWFILANSRIPGLWLVGAGAALNGVVIALNGGTLPAREGALRAAGIHVSPGQFVNSGLLSHPRLAFLGDVFAVPAPLPLANVFSVGDVLIVLGTAWTAWAVLGTRWSRPWVPRRGPLHRAEPAGADPLRARRAPADCRISRAG